MTEISPDKVRIPTDRDLRKILERLLQVLKRENPELPIHWIIYGPGPRS
jgi:hypothetical protein